MELKGDPPASNYIYGAVPEKLKKDIKDGVDSVVKHPEMLGTGNPKIMGDGLKKLEHEVEKAAHKVEDFFKNTFEFVKKHPETLLAKTEVKIFED